MPRSEIFQDRTDAGHQLTDELLEYGGRDDVIILALPRGGVPVAAEVARRLRLPLDVFVVRKLGVPGHEELAMGAIASGGVRVLNADVVNAVNASPETIDVVTNAEREELERRERSYRDDRPPLDVKNRTVILIDDGLATGATMRAAVAALRQQNAGKIVTAVPVGAASSCLELAGEADQAICLIASEAFIGVGQYYEDFTQTSDEEVRQLLRRSST